MCVNTGFPSDLGGTEAGPSGGEGDDLDSVDSGGLDDDAERRKAIRALRASER